MTQPVGLVTLSGTLVAGLIAGSMCSRLHFSPFLNCPGVLVLLNGPAVHVLTHVAVSLSCLGSRARGTDTVTAGNRGKMRHKSWCPREGKTLLNK